MSGEQQKPKKEVPQVNSITGLSFDYKNAYNSFVSMEVEKNDQAIDWFLEDARDIYLPRGYVLESYSGRFPSAVYGNVVSDRNRALIQRLDDLADAFNVRFMKEAAPLVRSLDVLSEHDRAMAKDLLMSLAAQASVVERLILGELIPEDGEREEPLNEEYLDYLSPLLLTSGSDLAWAEAVFTQYEAQGGLLLRRYREDSSANQLGDEKRQARIDRINAIVDWVNADLRDPDTLKVLQSRQSGVVFDAGRSAMRKILLDRAKMLERMVRGTSAVA